MKKYLTLLTISLLHWSCTEEVSKDINTDLSLEADQLFGFSEAISESSYLGNISYSEYLEIASDKLPGCPSVAQIPNTRIIELSYSSSAECDQANKIPRTGKVTLDFTLSESESPSWILTYDSYTFGAIAIEGSRHFEALSDSENHENFENLKVELENQVSFVATGSYTYSLVRSDTIPVALSTSGRSDGKNPAGRDFSLVITKPKEQLFECYRAGWDLPRSGEELWIVSRSSTNSLDYQASFQSTEDCNTLVSAALPDGRTLQLNP